MKLSPPESVLVGRRTPVYSSKHVEPQAAAGAVPALRVAVQERVAPAGHLLQPPAGHLGDLLEPGGEHEGLQPHPQRVRRPGR